MDKPALKPMWEHEIKKDVEFYQKQITEILANSDSNDHEKLAQIDLVVQDINYEWGGISQYSFHPLVHDLKRYLLSSIRALGGDPKSLYNIKT